MDDERGRKTEIVFPDRPPNSFSQLASVIVQPEPILSKITLQTQINPPIVEQQEKWEAKFDRIEPQNSRKSCVIQEFFSAKKSLDGKNSGLTNTYFDLKRKTNPKIVLPRRILVPLFCRKRRQSRR